MFKIIFYIIIFAVILISGASAYHLYQVKQKNIKDLAAYQAPVELNTDLGNVLVVYYSLSGHTKDIALQIQEKTHGDVYEIKTEKTYSSPSVYLESKKELSSRNYPELKKGFTPNMSNYDTVFVGGPVWWYTMAPALYSFLKKTDFKGVRVVPFSTQGSNYGKFFEDFKNKAQNAQILEPENFNNLDPSFDIQVSHKINAWLNKLSRQPQEE
ncbi:MAG: hypothetical protein J5896_00370 [Alphaproteobacteria bacterium]|nr:hypothetical protein [Alphaproteobacteria bacterium]